MGKEVEVSVAKQGKKSGLTAQIERANGKKKSVTLDLRVHAPRALGYFEVTGLSTAPALIRLAKVKGIDFLGVTDFYCYDFIDEVQTAARDTSVRVLPGVDLRCTLAGCDDVILSCFFDEGSPSSTIKALLKALGVPASAARQGDYRVQQHFDKVLAEVEMRSGFVLPGRIDKTPHRITVLPLLVEQYGFRAFEIAYPEETPDLFAARWPNHKFHLFSFSNATALAQVGSRIEKVKLEAASFANLKDLVCRSLPTASGE